ncbi:hypothetical protein BpHYR1_020313 [Brachionus plicatilis]|uniref:Uncharacterized protein n=1 Tax=Brachionus plicatilis TaxID=10195 RepID=A0A3M7RXR9_BRAPC|nr:hypothetical protein BpHYR1_020313 [Brachionus plicatilis]
MPINVLIWLIKINKFTIFISLMLIELYNNYRLPYFTLNMLILNELFISHSTILFSFINQSCQPLNPVDGFNKVSEITYLSNAKYIRPPSG